MVYSRTLSERVLQLLNEQGVGYHATDAFGDLTVMVNGRFCLSVAYNGLCVRLAPDVLAGSQLAGRCYADVAGSGCHTVSGCVFIGEDALADNEELLFWLNMVLQSGAVEKCA